MRALHVLASSIFVSAVLVVACSSDGSSSSSSSSSGGSSSGKTTSSSTSTSSTSSSTSTSSGSTTGTKTLGEDCTQSSECKEDKCVLFTDNTGAQRGFCSRVCTKAEDCPETGWECNLSPYTACVPSK